VVAIIKTAFTKQGYAPEALDALENAISKDVQNLRTATGGNKSVVFNMGDAILMARAESYAELMEAGRKAEGIGDLQAISDMAVKLEKFEGLESVGTRNAAEVVERQIERSRYFQVSPDLRVSAETLRDSMRGILNGDKEFSDAALLTKMRSQLVEKFPGQKIDDFVAEDGSPTSLGQSILMGRAHTDLSAEVSEDGFMYLAKIDNGDAYVLGAHSSLRESGRIGDRSGVAHELVHYRNHKKLDGIEKIARALKAAETDSEIQAKKKELLELIAVSGDFKAKNHGPDIHTNRNYARQYGMDEVDAFTAQARTELATARQLLSGSSDPEVRLRAAASLLISERYLGEAELMLETNRQHLSSLNALIDKKAPTPAYDPQTGLAKLAFKNNENGDGGWIDFQIRLPKNLSVAEAKKIFTEAIDHSLSETASAKSLAYLHKELQTMENRLASNSFGKTYGAMVGKASRARGKLIYTENVKARAEPSVRAAILYREAFDASQSDLRRKRLAIEKLPDLRLKLLQEEEDYLARRLALAEAEASVSPSKEAAARVAEMESAHSGVAAQYLGEKAALEARIAGDVRDGTRSSVQNVLRDLEKKVFGPHLAEHFPGQTLEQVSRDPTKVSALRELHARDLAKAQRYARESRETMARSLAKQLPGVEDPARGTEMAKQLEEAHGSSAVAAAKSLDEKRTAIQISLREKGWSPAQVEACIAKGICISNLEPRPLAAREREVSPAARAILAEVERARPGAAGTEEAKKISAHSELAMVRSFDEAIKEIATQKSVLAEELKIKQKLFFKSPKDTALSIAVKDVEVALAATDTKLRKLKENSLALDRSVLSSPGKEGQQNRAVAAVIQLLSKTESNGLSEIDPSFSTFVGRKIVRGEDRLNSFHEFKSAVSKLPLKKRQAVHAFMEKELKEGKGIFAKGLRESAETSSKSLARAIEKSDSLAEVTESPSLIRAIAEKEIQGERLALAEALGVIKGEKSNVERSAELAKASKEAKLERVALERADARISSRSQGRALASLENEGENIKKTAKEKMFGLGALQGSSLDELAESVAVFEKDLNGAEVIVERMRGLAADPEAFDAYRLTYIEAAKIMRMAQKENRDLSRNIAWDQGLREMLKKNGFGENEYMQLRRCFLM